jgi:5'-methylthioadenosine phosphorylase
MTGKLAVCGGHSILGSSFARDARRVEISVEREPVEVLDAGDWVVLQRHGLGDYTAAPYVDHARHFRALAALGCDRVLGIGSTGSLRADLPIGTFVAPDDFIALQIGTSVARDASTHQVPGFDAGLRRKVLDQWNPTADVELRDGGVYWQTIGPRFETPAEIRLMAEFADVVGMTIATECVIARELGLAYASVCVVDNLAHGIGAVELTLEEFHAAAARNQEHLIAALELVLPAIA